MPKWQGFQSNTLEDTKKYWSEADPTDMRGMMGKGKPGRVAWLKVATGVITEPGSVFEPGCGEGLITEALPKEFATTFYGCDLNEKFIAMANQAYANDDRMYDLRDLYDFLDEADKNEWSFDWVIVTSLFGLFPEDETYRLLKRFWELADKGMSVTTLNKKKYYNPRARKNQLTSHDPEELTNALIDLDGAGTILSGVDITDGNMNRKMAFYVYRDTFTGPKPDHIEGVKK